MGNKCYGWLDNKVSPGTRNDYSPDVDRYYHGRTKLHGATL